MRRFFECLFERRASVLIKDGTSRDDRLIPALSPGYINVDEMRLEDLLAMSSDYARLIRFFNLKNEPHGDWHPFFATDEAVIFSVILTRDLKQIESDFSRFMEETAWGMGSGMGRNLYLYSEDDWRRIPNYALAKLIDHWFTHLKQPASEAGRMFQEKIWAEIEGKLRRELHLLKLFLEQYGEGITLLFEQDFHRDWFHFNANVSVPSPSEKKETIAQFLKINFYAFFNTLLALQDAAGAALPLSLKSKTHPPSIGLYIAFAHLFKRAQEKLNRFTQRHLNFYYDEILKARPRERVPDSTYLVFRPSVQARSVWIPAGTAFVAGRDALNQDVLYAAEDDLQVNDATIAALQTLYFARDPLSSPENSMGFASAAKTNTLPVFEAGVEDAAQQWWPVFGAPKTEAGRRQYEDAHFGFALASPVLALKEGEREITLSIKMLCPAGDVLDKEGSEITLDQMLESILSTLKAQSDDLKPPSRGEKQAFFFKVFRQMFQISLSTENGWLAMEQYLPTCRIVDATVAEDVLKLHIHLSSETEAVTAYAPEIHGAGYETDLPLLRVMMNPVSYLFPYSLLTRFIVKEIRIDVTVNEARDLVMHNQLGRLDPSGPFNPFGPLPAVGSYFLISNPELARKQVTQFEMNIEWGELPLVAGGFETHYQGYPGVFDTTVFKARITALRGGRWQPIAEEEQEQVPLFRSRPCEDEGQAGEIIDKTRRLSGGGAVNFFKPVTGRGGAEDFAYSPEVKDGFFKLTLSAPEPAFGHKTYPMLLTRVLTSNARLKHPKLFKAIPNAPYTPLINAISINYSATDTIHLERSHSHTATQTKEKMFHIHPFGLEALSPESQRRIHLLPQYDSDGNLFIGLSATSLSGLLTLFFHMREDSTPETGTTPSEFGWFYLASNRWTRLSKSQVVSDTTSGFLTSGIVTLKLPKGINRENTVMPSEQYWLRVSVNENPAAFCSVYGIYTQAVKVRWQYKPGEASHLAHRLPAGTITSAKKSIPGISAMHQIVDSFGGRPLEKSEHIKKRISERLRHKNRATNPWDYERLILEHFPQIHKVKCFDNMVSEADPAKRSRPGHVLIVVIARRGEGSAALVDPVINGAVLKEVQAFVQHLASPFAKIAVRNPAYEQIQVRCTVKFREGARAGYYVDSLNRDISIYLSPWEETGYRAGFGWCIRRYEVEAFIRNLAYVEFVTDFSMLHITEQGQRGYRLFDTAGGDTADEKVDEIRPLFPWSIPTPLQGHFIKTMAQVSTIRPEVTGIDELEIGSTFIIAR